MKVPKHIIQAINKNAKAKQQFEESDEIVRKWLEENNLLNDHNLDQFIDEPTSLIDLLVEEQYVEGNDDLCINGGSGL